MDIKKKTFSEIASKAGKSASSLFEKAKDTVVKTVDQNDDGTIDFKDISSIAGAIGTSAKNAVASARESVEAKNRENERNALQPIFAEDLEAPDFLMPKLIRITEMDKKRAESEVCVGSIGFTSTFNEMRIVNIFRDKASNFGLSFYPNTDAEIYYIDPTDRDHYIALDEYFNYLKIARVNELTKIAQDLGAKHFRVTYKEIQSQTTDNSVKAKVSAKLTGQSDSTEAEHSKAMAERSSVEIAAESIFPGHAPMEPKLNYLQHDPSVQSLIALRMDTSSPTLHQNVTIKLSSSSGIKEKDAVKIDAALKTMKLAGSTSVVSEAQNEARRYFEYEVDF